MSPESIALLRALLQRASDGLTAVVSDLAQAVALLPLHHEHRPRTVRPRTASYTKCLVAGTPQAQMLQSEMPKEVTGLKAEDVARLEREMQALESDFRPMKDTHGRNVLDLVLAVGYVRRLLENAAVVKFLSRRHPQLLAELERVVEGSDDLRAREPDDPSAAGPA